MVSKNATERYFVLILNRFTQKWEVREYPNYFQAETEYDKCGDFPQLAWKVILLAKKVGEEKIILRTTKLYGEQKHRRALEEDDIAGA